VRWNRGGEATCSLGWLVDLGLVGLDAGGVRKRRRRRMRWRLRRTSATISVSMIGRDPLEGDLPGEDVQWRHAERGAGRSGRRRRLLLLRLRLLLG